jgi:hypothetical protein
VCRDEALGVTQDSGHLVAAVVDRDDGPVQQVLVVVDATRCPLGRPFQLVRPVEASVPARVLRPTLAGMAHAAAGDKLVGVRQVADVDPRGSDGDAAAVLARLGDERGLLLLAVRAWLHHGSDCSPG